MKFRHIDLKIERGSAGQHRGRDLAVPVVRHRPNHLPDPGLRYCHRSAGRTVRRPGAGHPVDRRFNRTRYDAGQTVTAFALRLKDAVDLDSVRGDLAQVVSRALEPAHLSVWVSHRD